MRSISLSIHPSINQSRTYYRMYVYIYIYQDTYTFIHLSIHTYLRTYVVHTYIRTYRDTDIQKIIYIILHSTTPHYITLHTILSMHGCSFSTSRLPTNALHPHRPVPLQESSDDHGGATQALVFFLEVPVSLSRSSSFFSKIKSNLVLTCEV